MIFSFTDVVLLECDRIWNSERQIRNKTEIAILPSVLHSCSKGGIVPDIVNGECQRVIDCSTEDVRHENNG